MEALEQAQANIEQQWKAIKALQERSIKSKGITKKALDVRLDKAWLKLLEQSLGFAKDVAAREQAGTTLKMARI